MKPKELRKSVTREFTDRLKGIYSNSGGTHTGMFRPGYKITPTVAGRLCNGKLVNARDIVDICRYLCYSIVLARKGDTKKIASLDYPYRLTEWLAGQLSADTAGGFFDKLHAGYSVSWENFELFTSGKQRGVSTILAILDCLGLELSLRPMLPFKYCGQNKGLNRCLFDRCQYFRDACKYEEVPDEDDNQYQ